MTDKYAYKLTSAVRDRDGRETGTVTTLTVVASDFSEAQELGKKLVAPLRHGYYWYFRATDISICENNTITYPLIIDKDFRE